MFDDVKKIGEKIPWKMVLLVLFILTVFYYREQIMSYVQSLRGEVDDKDELDQNKKLCIGQRSAEVKQLQRNLNTRGANPPLEVDGIFGPKTKEAVKSAFGTECITLAESLTKEMPKAESESSEVVAEV